MGVEGLLPELDFFDHLANRRFPVTWWIRRPDQVDYIEEPDLFHDLFGHVPLLMNPVFGDYMQAYGRGGVKAHAIGPDALQNLTRLYWYTVEFGLIRQKDGRSEEHTSELQSLMHISYAVFCLKKKKKKGSKQDNVICRLKEVNKRRQEK